MARANLSWRFLVASLLIGGLLMLEAGPALALVQNDRLLTRLDAYRNDGRIDIEIGLITGFRNVSHVLDDSQSVLEIRLRQEQSTDVGADTPEGVSSLQWTRDHGVPLGQVSSDLSGANPSVILHFTSPTRVLGVRASPDDRTLTVSILAPAAADKTPANLPGTGSGMQTGIFVVNLTSSPEERPLDATVADKAGQHVYRVRSRINDVLRYRQRLGFFDTAAQAKVQLARVSDRYPEAWVVEVTDLERDAVMAAPSATVDLAQIRVRSDTDPSLPVMTLERLTELMEDARAAASVSELSRAATIYERVSSYPVMPFRRDAAELLGVVREKSGHPALARAAYESYLERYPDDAGARRVRQRLQALVAPPIRISRKSADAGAASAAARWDGFGSLYQFYRYDQFQVNNESVQATRSLLSSDLDAYLRRRGTSTDLKFRLTGSYDHDFLDSSGSRFRTAMAYVDLATRDQRHSVRLGRQTRASGGVLGRFDGLYYGYRLNRYFKVNAVGGTPVSSTADSVRTDRVLYGMNVDIGPIAQNWNVNLYGVEQTVDGLTDRRAVGSELRFLNDNYSLFGLADYDIHFSEPNILYLIGSGTFFKATTVSLIADRRKSPLLSLSNAVIGQTETSISTLRQTYTEAQLKQLALDRTAVSTSYTASLSQAISSRYRVSADATSSKVSSTPASGGVDAMPESGPDWYYNLQLIGTELFSERDLGIFGVRYIDTTSYTGVSARLNYRFRAAERLDVNPQLRVDHRRTRAGSTQWIYAPGLRSVWNVRRRWTIEFELSAELSNQKFLDTTDKTKLYYTYLGYRYDF